jgi:hypothetical protein
MVHLIVHLATKVRYAGPVQYRAMWWTERFLGKVKGMVHSRIHPEGAIAEGYIFEESLNFYSRYVSGCQTVFNRPRRHVDCSVHIQNNYLVKLRRPLSASASEELDLTAWIQAQRCVLFNYPKISKFTK